MSLSLADLQTYLQTDFITAEGLTAPIQLNRLQDGPNQAIAISVAGGAAPILDGAFESTHVHCRVRDVTDTAAESLALKLHAFMSSHESSFTMGTTYVLGVEPSSGPPQYFDRDVDNRTTYMVSYLLTVAV